jgi:hypothetical protein
MAVSPKHATLRVPDGERHMRNFASIQTLAFLVAGTLALSFTAASARAQQQDNQQYLHWAKFKPGSTATMSGEADNGGQKVQLDMTNTLVEVTKDKVVLETSSIYKLGAQEQKGPPHKRDVPAKEEKKSEVKEVGEETIEAAGKKFKCKVIEGEGVGAGGNKAKAKVWVSEEVPGGAVKMVLTGDKGTMTFTLKSFEVK